jgi:hypothetical protein
MAIGDIQDITNRFLTQLPPWFGSNHPVLDRLINGYASISEFIYNQQYLYDVAQTRLQTAFGVNLDLIAQDYYGNTLTRNPHEPDDLYRRRIAASLLQVQCTLPGIFNILWRLTGHQPSIFEPGFSVAEGYYNVPSTLAYNVIGAYGSSAFPYTGFITVYVDADQSMGGFAGYDVTLAGYNVAEALWYGGESLDDGIIFIGDLIKLVNAIKVFGTIVNVNIVYTSEPPTFPPGIFI